MAVPTREANITPHNVAQLLPKLTDEDPDYRYMSLNDLYTVLTNGRPDFLYHDYNTAARAVDGIIKTLDDSNGEVQNLAIKCLVPLVQKIPTTILGPLLEKLSNMSTNHSVDSTIPALALRSVVITLPRPVGGTAPSKEVTESYAAVSRVLIPRLIGHLVVPPQAHVGPPTAGRGMLSLNGSKEVDAETVDVLIEVVRCFGPMLLEQEISLLQETVVGILENERTGSVVKKRAVAAISILAVYLPDNSLSQFISRLIESFTNSHTTLVQRRLYITILGSMARSIPARFGPYLQTLAPFVLSALSQEELDEQEAAAEDGDRDPECDDVREAALVALDAFLASCGHVMRAFTKETLDACVRFLQYDPNYTAEEEEEDDDMDDQSDDMDDLEEDDEFDDTAFEDDTDDASWKVRRCAAKTIHTLVGTRGKADLLENGVLYERIAPALISRFNEREQNVRLEVIAAMTLLVVSTGEGSTAPALDISNGSYLTQPQSKKRRRESSLLSSSRHQAVLSTAEADALPISGPRTDLQRLTPNLIKAITKQLRGQSIPTKQAVIQLLRALVMVQRSGLSQYTSQLFEPLIETITGAGTGNNASIPTATGSGAAAAATGSTLRIASLELMGDLAQTHSPTVLQSHVSKLTTAVTACAMEKSYKVSATALGAIEHIVRALTSDESSIDSQAQHELQRLYQVVVSRVSANDADLEVRAQAIRTLGVIIACTGNDGTKELLSRKDSEAALQILGERLKNETTRMFAVKAISFVAKHALAMDALPTPWIKDVAVELSAQLRKSNRQLRTASLDALRRLLTTPAASTSLDDAATATIADALFPLLSASELDLVLLGPALICLAALVKNKPQLVVTDKMNLGICDLLKAPLGGAVLDALLHLVNIIGEQGVGQALMKSLLQIVSINGEAEITGKVIGTLVVAGGSGIGVKADSFLKELHSNTDEARKALALVVLGEVGFRMGPSSSLGPEVFTTFFGAKSSSLSMAASTALGRAGCGNVALFMPIIIKGMQKGGDDQYLLLHTIKEMLSYGGSTDEIVEKTKDLWDQLMLASNVEDNKAVVAECIGRLAIVDPQQFMPILKAKLSDPSASVRAMVIHAIRYTLAADDDTFDGILSSMLVELLVTMMADTDLENRRLALTTLKTAATNKSELILPSLVLLLPLVLHESEVRPELVREVAMGPFKIKVDDGLDLRRSAYETLYAVLDAAATRTNILPFFDRLVTGLSDDHDIRTLCNLMLAKLVRIDPEETARHLDAIAVPLRVTLSLKLKENAVKQEIEKQDEAIRGVLRVTLMLNDKLPSAASGMTAQSSGSHDVWKAYWKWVESDFETQLRALRAESKTTTDLA